LNWCGAHRALAYPLRRQRQRCIRDSFGAGPATQVTGGAATASGTWTATEVAMLQKAYDALRTFGLLT